MGISIKDYNEMTPYELNLHVLYHEEKLRKEREEKVSIAYLTARMFRAEKLPPLEKFLDTEQNKQKQQSPEEMFAAVKRLHAKFAEE